ncbi:phage portal protein [Defluviitalea raffinosedens]|uniref:Phage portal protein n=1 Tax=Defluviitalea raffinosedens TaxID=1450156 RepID=A0A7C8LJ40_9FIRM|nr:phage portal protein [Defluviitalea raffinosedens]KAE9633715.1 phage portal protein [Defluviitalea raffinosedens]
MNGLSAFMAQNAIKPEEIEFIASKRFVQDGKPIPWRIKPISSDMDEELRKSCTRKVPVPGKKNVFIPETDYQRYLCKLAVACTVFPDLNDKELQDSYGVMGAEALLKRMLLPGELTDYIAKIQEINGFDLDMQDLVDDVKN